MEGDVRLVWDKKLWGMDVVMKSKNMTAEEFGSYKRWRSGWNVMMLVVSCVSSIGIPYGPMKLGGS